MIAGLAAGLALVTIVCACVRSVRVWEPDLIWQRFGG